MYSELLNRRFIALLIVSFFSSFVSAPLNTLLPVYVEADLLGTPLFSGGLRAAFLILGGVFAVPAGRLADTWGVKPVYVLGTLGPILAGVIFYSGDPLLLTALCTGIGISSGFNSAGGTKLSHQRSPILCHRHRISRLFFRQHPRLGFGKFSLWPHRRCLWISNPRFLHHTCRGRARPDEHSDPPRDSLAKIRRQWSQSLRIHSTVPPSRRVPPVGHPLPAHQLLGRRHLALAPAHLSHCGHQHRSHELYCHQPDHCSVFPGPHRPAL